MARGHHPANYWNHARCKERALLYKTKTEFCKGDNGAYTYALRHGILNDICGHMIIKWQKKYASKEACRKEALKYKTRSEFALGCDGAYTYAMRHGFLQEICSHMPHIWKKRYASKEACHKEALKYKRRIDFANGCDGAYTYALRHGFLDEICGHMQTYFDVDTSEADKRRAEYVKNELQITDSEWQDMKSVLTNPNGYALQSNRARKKRLIYACEFSDNHVYVGLARDLKNRIAQHIKRKHHKTAISEYIKLNPDVKYEFKIVRPFEDEEQAKISEGIVEKEYSEQGWIILNRAKTGALGGYPSYWNHDRCMAVAGKCFRRMVFVRKFPGAYASCIRNGWYDEASKIIDQNMFNKWGLEHLKEESSKYPTRRGLRSGNPEAHEAAIKQNLIDILYPKPGKS